VSNQPLASEVPRSVAVSTALEPAVLEPVGSGDVPETLIAPVSGWRLVDFRELWRYRELLLFFTWRDVLVRYKQTVLGAAWAMIQPLMMMVVFTIFLGRMAKVDSGGYPYPVFVYAGLLPWTFFSTAITRAGNSVVGATNIITKIYFPRLLVPFASVGAAAVDFLLAFTILLGLMLFYGIQPGWSMFLVPVLLVLAALAALGVGTILAALNVSYRDFKYTIPFLAQVWMFATPTVYMNVEAIADPAAQQQTAAAEAPPAQPPAAEDTQAGETASGVSTAVKALLRANPMTGLIAFFRAATLGDRLPWRELGYSTMVILAVFVCGVLYFRRVESRFADII